MNIKNEIYFNNELYPTIDRFKPYRPSNLLQYPNNGSRWEEQGYFYALDKCEHLRKDTGWSEGWLSCMNERFQNSRYGDGGGYKTLTPTQCGQVEDDITVEDNVKMYCRAENKEYTSLESYKSCVDKVQTWSENGCGNRLDDLLTTQF